MGEVHPGIPVDLARRLADALGLTVAVETGTHVGDSARALAEMFQVVHTIELSPALLATARQRLQDLKNVVFHLGSSVDLIEPIVAQAAGPQLYWLDGHWSGGATAGEAQECPVLDEIRAIDNGSYAGHSAIMIDDARLFLVPPPPPHKREHWPPVAEVFDQLRATCNRYVTIVEDVIVAVPLAAQGVVDEYGMASRNRALRSTTGWRHRRRRSLR